jgi:hypothetical protein
LRAHRFADPGERFNRVRCTSTGRFGRSDGLRGPRPDQAQAVILRLIALRKIAKQRRASGWSLATDGKSYVLTNRALFEAAAQAPLRMPKSLLMKDLAFHQNELLAIALTAAPPFGSE